MSDLPNAPRKKRAAPKPSAKPKARRFGTEQSSTRTVILDAAEKVIIEEGYAAVTTRRIAERAGIKAPLVHYYYKTIDDLLTAVYRRGAEQSLQRHAEAMSRGDLLRALWEVNADPERTALAIEFMAMANHRKFIREEIARYAEQIRAIQVVALTRHFRERELPEKPFAALPLTVMLASVARSLVMEDGVGIHLGHSETRQAIEAFLDSYPGDLTGLFGDPVT
ncbi:TetR/AcrR family transcriptional regulator [Sphingobium terrigena]|uniref:TetR/AcrR family transcriptional regulator n=1 Tax=Sphingobium terrigena TaxID=2304063 RepID=A0A418YPN0_9SPHN|nr:TetR/AcrR family transcriptional regulator [Sphingobium terrigena]RJG53295.1 TetR/AcrR family transcriptional regulator [Sphingobium terrigena]